MLAVGLRVRAKVVGRFDEVRRGLQEGPSRGLFFLAASLEKAPIRCGSPGSPQTILGEYRASPGEGLPDTRRRRYAPHEEKPGIPTPRAPSDRIRQPLFIITPGAYVIRYPDSSSTKKKPRPPKIARFLSPSVMELPPKP